MSVFEEVAPPQPTAEQHANEVKRALARTFQQIERSLQRVRRLMDEHGAAEIKSALGPDAAEVETLYNALKEIVESHKPEAEVETLPQ